MARAFKEEGWEQLRTDAATYVLKRNGNIVGICVGHVDDLLMGGDDTARDSLDRTGALLGFGRVDDND